VDDPLAGRVKPGEVSNEIGSRLDWCWTLLAAAGDPDVKDKLLKGYDAILLATLLSWGAQLRSPSRRLKPAPLPRKPRPGIGGKGVTPTAPTTPSDLASPGPSSGIVSFQQFNLGLPREDAIEMY
jgi:hypothetical protein